jgi:hypothetical protein
MKVPSAMSAMPVAMPRGENEANIMQRIQACKEMFRIKLRP